ncbi:MAG TPA: tyrosinase family protein [Solirubrobacterales bacterium]
MRSLSDDTLAEYAAGVGVMKKRNPADKTSWWYQAAIHGSQEAADDLYNQCKHGSWYFLAWHRMYLYYFERIVRAAVVEAGGSEDWALPYWNYAIDRNHSTLPDGFRKPDDEATNPLFVALRRPPELGIPGINEGAGLPWEKLAEAEAKALARPQFIGDTQVGGFGGGRGPAEPKLYSQTGVVELRPHNNVHNLVGKEGWMADEDAAAKDPIFWLHHANIDRIWAQWQSDGNQNPTEGAWRDEPFAFFDVDGGEDHKTPGQVLDTVTDLEYAYDVVPSAGGGGEPEEAAVPAGAAEPDPKVVAAGDGLILTGGPEDVSVPFEQRAQAEVEEASRETDPRDLYLNIEDIEAKMNPGTVYAVYVNLPKNPNQETLDAHYAGSISFFGIERTNDPRADEHPHGLRYSLEIGDLLRSLGDGERYKEEGVHVTFRPETLEAPEGMAETEALAIAEAPKEESPVQIGRVSLSVG